MMKAKPFLSVIIPAYNEEANLKRGVLEEVWAYLEAQKYQYELILSDDESTDETLAALKEFAREHQGSKHGEIVVLANKHGGKAPTVTAGMLAARGEWRLFTDFDQSTPLSEVEKLLKYKNDDYGIIFGSREISGAERQKEPWYRHFMGRGFNLITQILAVPGILDTQCGFKMFSEEATEALFPQLYVYKAENGKKDAFTGAFDVELFFLARKIKIRYKEVAIIWKHNQTDRVAPVKDSWRMLMDILKIRLADLNGKYQKVGKKNGSGKDGIGKSGARQRVGQKPK